MWAKEKGFLSENVAKVRIKSLLIVLAKVQKTLTNVIYHSNMIMRVCESCSPEMRLEIKNHVRELEGWLKSLSDDIAKMVATCNNFQSLALEN